MRVLNTYTDYFTSKKNANIAPSQVLGLCMLLYTFETHETWHPEVQATHAWKVMFQAAVSLLPHDPTHWRGASLDEDTEAAEIAYEILRTLNEVQNDGLNPYRGIRRFADLTSDDVGQVDDYDGWKEAFDVATSQVPDEMVDVLRKIASSTCDEDGRTFWRVRRLEDMMEVDEPDTESIVSEELPGEA